MNINSVYLFVKPEYVKVKLPSGKTYLKVKEAIKGRELVTVCEEARCPNVAECWGSGTATFMVMGSVCTRGCRFCSVTHGTPAPLDPLEPEKVAMAVRQMKLSYVVITSVDRDDLPDFGANHFSNVIREVKRVGAKVEVLIPDFQGRKDLIDIIMEAAPTVIGHNIETVRRLTPKIRDPRAGYEQSLSVLKYIKDKNRDSITKSSIMLGLGETDDEVIATMRDLRAIGVNILTIGQYLRPSRMQVAVAEYSPVERFERLKDVAYDMGFSYVASGPLVRSSYRALEAWLSRSNDNSGGEYD